ncbi:DUF2628 domain-containing protein [Companilactobacillus zhachilii]|uniref:DUF2628 domain-containing protein n=1 Tax=Companilactobacillus zhachilii TaxID=2304606 RepID=UPI00403384CD
MHAILINRRTNERKDVKVGFSWTEFFWGFWPALFRGDWKWLIIILIANLTLGAWNMGFGTILFNMVFAFFYNKLYTADLINAGFEPADEGSYNTLVMKNYIAPDSRFSSNNNNNYTINH